MVDHNHKIEKINPSELHEGPIQHPKGLSPFLTDFARLLHKRIGHYVESSFEKWELGFMRDINPKRELFIWETIARAYETYVKKHPKCDHKKIALGMASISAGGQPDKVTKQWKEMQRIWNRTWKETIKDQRAVITEVAKAMGYKIIDGQITK